MKYYNSSFEGLFARIIAMKSSVMPKAFVISLVPGIISGILVATYPDGRIPFFSEDGPILLETQAWNGFSFFVGFLLVFRTTQAYNRFWEACGAVLLMRAEWFDSAAALISFSRDSEGQPLEIIRGWQEEVIMLICCVHASALVELRDGPETSASGGGSSDLYQGGPNLREQFDKSLEGLTEEEKEERLKNSIFMWTPDQVCQIGHFDEETREILKQCNPHDRVCLFFEWVQNHIVFAHAQDIVDISPPILSRVFQQLSQGMTAFYKALKVSQVPFPFPYAQVCDLLLLIHWSLIPLVISQWTTHWFWAVVFCTIQVLVLWSLNLIALEIESPFGKDLNDIDLEKMQTDFNRSALFLLTEEGLHTPLIGSSVTGEYKSSVDEVNKLLQAEQEEADRLDQALIDELEEAMGGGESGDNDGEQQEGMLQLDTDYDNQNQGDGATTVDPTNNVDQVKTTTTGGVTTGTTHGQEQQQDIIQSNATGHAESKITTHHHGHGHHANNPLLMNNPMMNPMMMAQMGMNPMVAATAIQGGGKDAHSGPKWDDFGNRLDGGPGHAGKKNDQRLNLMLQQMHAAHVQQQQIQQHMMWLQQMSILHQQQQAQQQAQQAQQAQQQAQQAVQANILAASQAQIQKDDNLNTTAAMSRAVAPGTFNDKASTIMPGTHHVVTGTGNRNSKAKSSKDESLDVSGVVAAANFDQDHDHDGRDSENESDSGNIVNDSKQQRNVKSQNAKFANEDDLVEKHEFVNSPQVTASPVQPMSVTKGKSEGQKSNISNFQKTMGLVGTKQYHNMNHPHPQNQQLTMGHSKSVGLSRITQDRTAVTNVNKKSSDQNLSPSDNPNSDQEDRSSEKSSNNTTAALINKKKSNPFNILGKSSKEQNQIQKSEMAFYSPGPKVNAFDVLNLGGGQLSDTGGGGKDSRDRTPNSTGNDHKGGK